MADLLIKICGVTRPEDAKLAMKLGADRIGIIFSSKARRGVDGTRARSIADATRQAGGTPVGVFVESSPQEIRNYCQTCNINHIQLHGPNPQKMAILLFQEYALTLSIGVEASGLISPSSNMGGEGILTSEYLLYDYHEPGSGRQFDYTRFEPPCSRPWILAGGLNAENVRKAIRLLQPDGVDVSSGVEGSRAGEKEQKKLEAFITAARKQ